MKQYSPSEIAVHKKKVRSVKNIKHRARMEEKTRNGGVNATKKLFCKTCKKLFAFKSEGSVELSSSDSRSSCNHCKHPRLEIICRVCNVWVKSPHHFTTEQKYEKIERHLDSDKHFQKEQVFQSYILYATLGE